MNPQCEAVMKKVQLALVISKSMRLSEILRDTRTSIYQICRIKEHIDRANTFHKCILEIY